MLVKNKLKGKDNERMLNGNEINALRLLSGCWGGLCWTPIAYTFEIGFVLRPRGRGLLPGVKSRRMSVTVNSFEGEENNKNGFVRL